MKKISPLTPEDLPAAYQLELIAHPFPWSESVFYSNQGDRYFNLKISDDDQLIGYAICQIVADEATLFNIAINPKFRRQGLAKMLLNEVIAQLSSMPKPIRTLWLEVRASNKAAINLYNVLGFNELTVRKKYYPTKESSHGEDAIIMAYTLML
ncbi:ribosomal protein S18-alanine N-acetyltransferase [Orbaceae bacterium ESL0721]|nr:ribosomal protein S18-alanine N-acetyltransferase [Orbaceae bacterium ESL0721]